jgi:hypothetical protein
MPLWAGSRTGSRGRFGGASKVWKAHRGGEAGEIATRFSFAGCGPENREVKVLGVVRLCMQAADGGKVRYSVGPVFFFVTGIVARVRSSV